MPNILTVEDHELNRASLARWLLRRGYEVGLWNPPPAVAFLP